MCMTLSSERVCIREKGRENKMRKSSENVIAAIAVPVVVATAAAAATAAVWRKL